MRYCPNCGTEYRPGFDRCSDCDVALVDEPPSPEEMPAASDAVELTEVYSSGRSIDAEVVRSMLEGHGIEARLWGGGLGHWRMESALTEMTGVPNAFNAHRVMVPPDQADDARALVADVELEISHEDVDASSDGGGGVMNVLRSRAVMVGAALFLLGAVVFLGVQGTQ